eukprot:c12205_g1_i1.p1 GENE.c12205_g1_i1~~c12205_g1_i1.p1  ORF type:complete len:283 (+),score=56.44 c12205_g1_i1:34-882(+)
MKVKIFHCFLLFLLMESTWGEVNETTVVTNSTESVITKYDVLAQIFNKIPPTGIQVFDQVIQSWYWVALGLLACTLLLVASLVVLFFRLIIWIVKALMGKSEEHTSGIPLFDHFSVSFFWIPFTLILGIACVAFAFMSWGIAKGIGFLTVTKLYIPLEAKDFIEALKNQIDEVDPDFLKFIPTKTKVESINDILRSAVVYLTKLNAMKNSIANLPNFELMSSIPGAIPYAGGYTYPNVGASSVDSSSAPSSSVPSSSVDTSSVPSVDTSSVPSIDTSSVIPL